MSRLIPILALLILSPHRASGYEVPFVSLGGSFFSVQSEALSQTTKLASKTQYSLGAGMEWVLNRQGTAAFLHGTFQQIELDARLSAGNPLSLFGGEGGLATNLGALTLGGGVGYAQYPLLEVFGAADFAFYKVAAPALPFRATLRLIALERKVLRFGVHGAVLLGSSKTETGESFSGGAQIGAHLHLEYRSTVNIRLVPHTLYRSFQTRAGPQEQVELGLRLEIRLPGRRGLTPPVDERG